MNDKQVCGIMAAIIFNRMFELEGWGFEVAANESARAAEQIMKLLDRPHEIAGAVRGE